MIEKIIDVFSRIVFGKKFIDGYINDIRIKDEFVLTSLFPNESVREKAIKVLEDDKSNFISIEKIKS